MLYFATKPDPVYTALIDVALTDARSWADDSHRWLTWACHVIEGFPARETPRDAIPELQAAHRKRGVYRMSHLFWVLLYDVLSAYTTRHNAHFKRRSHHQVDAMPTIGPYRCGPIRMPSVVATYWWDLSCFPETARDWALVPPPAAHRVRGGPERYAPMPDDLVEIRQPRWAPNPDAAELDVPGLTVPHYPLFAAPAVADAW